MTTEYIAGPIGFDHVTLTLEKRVSTQRLRQCNQLSGEEFDALYAPALAAA